jgi:hypothetical protein
VTHLPVSTNVQPGWRFDHYAYPVLANLAFSTAGPTEVSRSFDEVPEGQLWMVQHLLAQFAGFPVPDGTRTEVYLDNGRPASESDYLRSVVAAFPPAEPISLLDFAHPLHVPELHRLSVRWTIPEPVAGLTLVARAQIAVYVSTDRPRNA